MRLKFFLLLQLFFTFSCGGDTRLEVTNELRRWIRTWNTYRDCVFPSPQYGPDASTTASVARVLRGHALCVFTFDPAVDMERIPDWYETDQVARGLPSIEIPTIASIDAIEERVNKLRGWTATEPVHHARPAPVLLTPERWNASIAEDRCEHDGVSWTLRRSGKRPLLRVTRTTRWEFEMFKDDKLVACHGAAALLLGWNWMRRCRNGMCFVVHHLEWHGPRCAAGFLDDGSWLLACAADPDLLSVWREDIKEPTFYRLPSSDEYFWPRAVRMRDGSPYVVFHGEAYRDASAFRLPRFP